MKTEAVLTRFVIITKNTRLIESDTYDFSLDHIRWFFQEVIRKNKTRRKERPILSSRIKKTVDDDKNQNTKTFLEVVGKNGNKGPFRLV